MKLNVFIRVMLLTIVLVYSVATSYCGTDEKIYLRVNQIGYRSDDPKIAMAFSKMPLSNSKFEIRDAENNQIVSGPIDFPVSVGKFGNFNYHYRLVFSRFNESGRYKIQISGTSFESLPFNIGNDVYNTYLEYPLKYSRQQRCGYNPFFDEVCHQKDGRTMYGPMPDSTFIDVKGGWHDAADYLRYLLTSGNVVCRLLFAYREKPKLFQDEVNELGQFFPNGVADILDEAKWGLDWMFKMQPQPNQLFHQVADDRDHIGFKMPYADSADYGWGPGEYRVVYYANGEPQGLGKYQNTSTGIANLAGRFAAAMAMATDIWSRNFEDTCFARKCLKAAKEVYQMGLGQPGCQEGTPCRAPYRYHESTWADDMEWGAAELYRVTGEQDYLEQAKRFARMANTISWMGADTAKHYEYYPFMNIGHYALFELVDESFQDTLIQYYREGIERVEARAKSNPYGIGIPFIWCSNNLAAAFVNQCILYEKMSGDKSYQELMFDHLDWLLGRNPWSVTQFVGIPSAGGCYPKYPHSVVTLKLDKEITGGLNDGPVYASIFKQLKGIRLSRSDPFAEFQSDVVVYHDDIWDYSTNEPTLDGTAESIIFFSNLANISMSK